jgi:hypothetical protein
MQGNDNYRDHKFYMNDGFRASASFIRFPGLFTECLSKA